MNFLTSKLLIEKIEDTYQSVNLQLWNHSHSHLKYYFNKIKGDIPEISKAVLHKNIFNFYRSDGSMIDFSLQRKLNSNKNYVEFASIVYYIRGEHFGKENMQEGFTIQ